MPANKRILIVEDSEMVSKILRHLMLHQPGFDAVFAYSLAEARAFCEAAETPFFAALVDLNLPDAPQGEIVDYVLGQKIPTIVLTGTYDEKRREQLFNKGIVDYVTKEGRYAYAKAVAMLERLVKNQSIRVLVVDDSDLARKHLANLLRRHLFPVEEASDAKEAIRILLPNQDIRLLVTDYNMPGMDGFELVRNLRYQYEKNDLIMIGISGDSNEALSAKFIKHGANDFLRKPFHPEEFYCRITHNVESLEMMERIADAAQRDHLTGLFHRYHFFNVAREKHRIAREQQSPLTAVALDIDNFSEINRLYGNDCGDALLQSFAQLLEQFLGRFLLARADGDAFYALFPGVGRDKTIALISGIKQRMQQEPFIFGDQAIAFTFSVGVTDQLLQGVEAQMSRAVTLSEYALEAGGDMTVDDESEN